MFPTSIDSITYQDIFRLLHQRQSRSNQPQSPNADQKAKSSSHVTPVKPVAQNVSTTSNSEASPAQPLQTLLMLALLNNNPQLSGQITKNLSVNSLLTPSQNKNKEKSLLELLSSANTSDKEQIDPNRESSNLHKSSSLSEKASLEKRGKVGSDQTNKQSKYPSDLAESSLLDSRIKKIKKTNVCGHPDRSHYAKNMCNQCYHKFGRTKRPWRCNHDRLYAHGLCQNCYINAYNKKRSLKGKEDNTDPNSSPKDSSLPLELLPGEDDKPEPMVAEEDKTTVEEPAECESSVENSEQC